MSTENTPCLSYRTGSDRTTHQLQCLLQLRAFHVITSDHSQQQTSVRTVCLVAFASLSSYTKLLPSFWTSQTFWAHMRFLLFHSCTPVQLKSLLFFPPKKRSRWPIRTLFLCHTALPSFSFNHICSITLARLRAFRFFYPKQERFRQTDNIVPLHVAQ